MRVCAGAFVVGVLLVGPTPAGIASADDSAHDAATTAGHHPGAGPARGATRQPSAGPGTTHGSSARRVAADVVDRAETAGAGSGKPSRVVSRRDLRATLESANQAESVAPAVAAAGSMRGAATPARAIAETSTANATVDTALPTVARTPRIPPTCATCTVGSAPGQFLRAAITHFFDSATEWLSHLPANPIADFLSGALQLVRRTFFSWTLGSGSSNFQLITFPELDSASSTLAVRVDPGQQRADAIKVDAGTTFTLTLPGPTSDYTVLANKPDLVQITPSGNQIQVTATKPGFLGLAIRSQDGAAERYVGLYIADPATHAVPDTVEGYLPVGTVTTVDGSGDTFLESFNFRTGVAPIDYAYIYDQGGAGYSDGNLSGLLTQALRHGMVPVVVYYNIQNVLTPAGQPTGVVEGPDAAYQAINDYNVATQQDPSLFTNYMQRYYAKMATDFGTMNKLGVPVQVVMEPDFLSYMAISQPTFQAHTFVPVAGDRTQNTAEVSAMYDQGLLTRGVDPDFQNNLAGMVQAINYYVGSRLPNVRIGWKTNIWSVADQQNWSLGLLHMTDQSTYPWQGTWTKPAPTWTEGRDFIAAQGAKLAAFLAKVGVTSLSGAPGRTPFLAIDKYGVDGAYAFDPNIFSPTTQTAAFGNLSSFVVGAYGNVASLSDADSLKYFGLSKAAFQAFYAKYGGNFPAGAADVRAVFTTLQNAAKADPNLAQWFFNADQWNNYLLLVKSLSDGLGGTKVMLWQIPQGHVNGSTTLSGRDLTNTNANFEDSATSYFFGDSFTATGGRFAHFAGNQATDAGVSVVGSTITWGEHMTLARQSGAMSVLFGAGLGVSTRGSPTPGGGINDHNFWYDKATGYLSGA